MDPDSVLSENIANSSFVYVVRREADQSLGPHILMLTPVPHVHLYHGSARIGGRRHIYSPLVKVTLTL